MKIKTIVQNSPDTFDEQVNKALEAGYLLERREVLVPNTSGTAAHYAQLVLPDSPADPETADIFQALHTIKAACLAQPRCDICPLTDWCGRLGLGGDPTDWELPDLEVPDA